MLLTLLTAVNTPLPKNLLESPSLSSNASREPVEAPDGTIALPKPPFSVVTSTSIVGLPLESITSLAHTLVIFDISTFPFIFLLLTLQVPTTINIIPFFT